MGNGDLRGRTPHWHIDIGRISPNLIPVANHVVQPIAVGPGELEALVLTALPEFPNGSIARLVTAWFAAAVLGVTFQGNPGALVEFAASLLERAREALELGLAAARKAETRFKQRSRNPECDGQRSERRHQENKDQRASE